MFEQLDEVIKKDYSNMTGIVIIKDNECVFESYFNGYKDSEAIHLTSVTKSITSLLIGIAIDKGYIDSVNQKVLNFFPDYTLKRGENTIKDIEIRHLLTMTAPYKFKSEPYTKVYGTNDWTTATLDLLGGRKPIGEFKYTSIGIHLLSGLIENATGLFLLDFAYKYLFEPLGIEKPKQTLIPSKESYMAFIKYRGVNAWISDPSDSYTTGWGLALKVKDIAVIGQMITNDGKMFGQQIISKEWIKESSIKHSEWQGLSYGYMWWLVDDNETNSFAAIGDGGNILFIDPELKIVVAITSSFKPRYEDRIKLIREHILNCL